MHAEGPFLRRSLIFLALISLARSNESLYFNGSTYISYLYTEEGRTLPDEITILFRTIKPSGLLFHAASDKGDFITLELLRGKIRYSVYVGRIQNVSTYREGFLGRDLADNGWHQLNIKRKDRVDDNETLTIYVGREKEKLKVPGFLSRRFSHQRFYFGGINDAGRELARHRPQEIPFVGFLGCFGEEVEVNGRSIRDMAGGLNATEFDCSEETDYSPVTFEEPESFAKIQNLREKNSAEYSFKFRTYNGAGLLIHQTIRKKREANIVVSLESGRVRLQVKFTNKMDNFVTLLGGATLYDGMWHSVSMVISIDSVTLKVDGEVLTQRRDVTTSSERFVSSSEVFVGARDRERPGFVGCMRDLWVQGKRVNFSSLYSSKVTAGRCSLKDLCLSSPCKNGGRCSQLWNRTKCDCSGTDFKGPKCEKPAFFMQTCADWWYDGKRRNGFYKINPLHSKPFLVYCNMSNTGRPSTIIYHAQDRNPTIASRGRLVEGNIYVHNIYYEFAEMRNIQALINTSTSCRQYLRYSCFNSVLFDSPNKFNTKLGRGARWVSQDGRIQDYWSGASPGSAKCACGVNGTCEESRKVCNCDSVSEKWRMDDGYLTESNALPVKKLLFSVNGTSSRSKFVLGSLECFGSTTERPTQSATPKTHVTKSSMALHVTKLPSTTKTLIHSEKSSPPSLVPHTTKPLLMTENPTTLVLKRSTSTTFRVEPSAKRPSLEPASKPNDTIGPPPIVVIETPKKYITIRENGNQEIVLIILSIILAVFVIAIIILIVKQNLSFPCKCLHTPQYQDVHRIDNIELGSPSPMYGGADPEILQFETSPYPARNYDVGFAGDSCRATSSPELLSDAETDRLDISNGSSSWNSENGDIEKEESENLTPYKDVDLGLLDVVPFTLSRQLGTDQQIEKLKEVILDVLSASDVITSQGDKNEPTPENRKNETKATEHFQPDPAADQTFEASNEHSFALDNESTGTVSGSSVESVLSLSAHSLRSYMGDGEPSLDLEKELDEDQNQRRLENVDDQNIGREDTTHGSWTSTDPHDNYLSLDLNHVEDSHLSTQITLENSLGSFKEDPTLCRQSVSEMNTNSPGRYQRYVGSVVREETKRNAKSRRDDKRRRIAHRSLLFSRQKSEEEALLSSTRRKGLSQHNSNQVPEKNRKRYNGILNASCHAQQQQQHDSLEKLSNKHENNEPLEDCKNDRAKIITQNRAHAKRFETEL